MQIVHPETKKVMGELRDDLVYISHRSPEHFFIKFNGYGISMWVLEILEASGCNEIRIIYHGSKGDKVFITTPKQFRINGHQWNDNGESQLILSESDFDRTLADDDETVSEDADLKQFISGEKYGLERPKP